MRWVVCETAEKPNTQEHIPVKCPWKLQRKLPEMMVEHFLWCQMFFLNLLQWILFEKVFNSVSQYRKGHKDPRSVLNYLEIKAFKVYMAISKGKGEVTKRQSVDSKNIRMPLEPVCQVGEIRVGLEWDCKISIQWVSLYSIGSQLIF